MPPSSPSAWSNNSSIATGFTSADAFSAGIALPLIHTGSGKVPVSSRLKRSAIVSNDAAISGAGQFELLQPIDGPNTHMEFLKMNGEGVHHFSFGEVDDHDEVVSDLGNQGINVEMSGLLGGATTFTYMATQKDLGTIMELVKVRPGVENSLVPYGTYPPDSRLSP